MLIALCLSALAYAEEVPPTAPPAPVEVSVPVEPAAPAAPAAPSAEPLSPEGLLGLSEADRAAYQEGRRLGVEAARAQAVLAPAIVAGAVGFGLSAPAVLLVGPCCGAPVVSMAALAPGVYFGGRPPVMPSGWQSGVSAQDLGFEQGYVGTLRNRKVTTMLVFGVAGAAAGVGVGMVTTKILLNEWGYN